MWMSYLKEQGVKSEGRMLLRENAPRDTVMETLGWSFFPFHVHSKQNDFCTRRKQQPLKIQDPPAEWSFPTVWRTSESPSVMSDSLQPHGLYSPWNSPGQNTGVGSLSLLQGIFPTQGLNLGLPHCQRIVYQLSHNGSPRLLEWVAYRFSRGSSQPRNRTGVSCIAGGFFTNWAMHASHFHSIQVVSAMNAFEMHLQIS